MTFTYDANEMGALAMAPTVGDGEDDSYGDYTVAFSAGGIGVTYTKTKRQATTRLRWLIQPVHCH